MAEPTVRVEYRTHYTYPYLEAHGVTKYGPPARSTAEANSRAMDYDDGYYWAGKTLGHQRRIVTETEWEDVE